MYVIVRNSDWTYNTGATAGGGIGPLAFSGGDIVLDDPKGQSFTFSYRGMGLGFTLARLPKSSRLPDLKLPKYVFKNKSLTGSVGTKDFFGRGWVGLLPPYQLEELKPEHFNGGTIYIDASVGVLVAGGASLLLCGIPKAALTALVLNPGLFARLATNCARVAILIAGESAGLVDSLGYGLMIGGMQFKGRAPKPPVQ